MPTRNEREARLLRFRNPNSRQELRSRLDALPETPAVIGNAYLAILDNGLSTAEYNLYALRRSLIETQPEGARAALFEALFPGISVFVESSWQLQKKLPYLANVGSGLFRAPNSPAHSAYSRQLWLEILFRATIDYKLDVDFLLEWASLESLGPARVCGLLLAGAVDGGGTASDAILDGLARIATGAFAVGASCAAAVDGLVACSRPEAWEVVEKLLLSAQRQEGLRQTIFASASSAHRDAFVRLLQLIAREGLSRFASVAQAVTAWFAIPVDSGETWKIDEMVRDTLENLEDASVCDARIAGKGGQTLYLALWARAVDDAARAESVAEAVAKDADFDRRYPAVYLLARIPTQALLSFVRDSDLRIALTAADALQPLAGWGPSFSVSDQTFGALAELLPRVPEDRLLAPAVWEWNRIRARKADIARRLVLCRGDRPTSALAAYTSSLDANGRYELLRDVRDSLKKGRAVKSDDRDLALSLLGDAAGMVRREALQILEGATLTPDEARPLEALLTRSASDLRRGVIRLLLNQPESERRASIERLAASRKTLMKRASDEMQAALKPTDPGSETVKGGLGLFDPAKRTPVVEPRVVDLGPLVNDSVRRVLDSLRELINENRETPVTVTRFNGEAVVELLGNLQRLPRDAVIPLTAMNDEWWQGEDSPHRGATDVDVARAMVVAKLQSYWRQPAWYEKMLGELIPGVHLEYHPLVISVLEDRLAKVGGRGAISFLLDTAGNLCCWLASYFVPDSDRPDILGNWQSWAMSTLMEAVENCRSQQPQVWDSELWRRYWALLRWQADGISSQARYFPRLEITLAARKQGIASDADLYDQLLGGSESRRNFRRDLEETTQRKPHALFAEYPDLAAVVDRCRNRVVEIELGRGDLPTEVSPLALGLSAIYGADLCLTLLKRREDLPLSRGYARRDESKEGVFSHLVRVCLPANGDTPESFAAAARRYGVPAARLIELALYAPQWAAHVERTTRIRGLEDAIYWLHAHTKDTHWVVERQITELWFAEVSERTPLTQDELLEGAVDVDWFHRMRTPLSRKNWTRIFDAAKYAASGNGHRRAQMFADALSGDVEAVELAARISGKRNQDAVRAIGLVPLPRDQAMRRTEILLRYETLQQFVRGGRDFGSQRQASEKLAFSVGLANLARTAGYADPQRLSWAMEAEAISDLKAGPVSVSEGNVSATLSIDAAGEPQMTFARNGKNLKALPASARQLPAFSELQARKSDLARQTSRMRRSLEEGMIRGDQFTGAELAQMAEHPLLKPMLATLLLVDEDGSVAWFGNRIDRPGKCRIAHPVDLLESKRWAQFQRECLEAGRVQPFKQAFRELYLVTTAEHDTKTYSQRYEGNQVNPRQAQALLGGRGWVSVPYEGIRKTFHHEGISVWVSFVQGWFTPAAFDGLTIGRVHFWDKAAGVAIASQRVNPRVFSEAMRDLDLMVSVAHRGGVDPETSASTVEMRSDLLRETLALMKIGNVRLMRQYALVDGTLGAYNIHLGSGTVRRQPGGAICIVPVHSQHRGRLFLPFADNDPKTAEIMSKVILLAQDDKIKDPTILEQLR